MDVEVGQRVQYGRREGRQRDMDQKIGFAAQGIDARQVLVLQPHDWRRIQNNLSKYNREIEQSKQRSADREAELQKSKEKVKNWGNTIEGQRLKRLQARQIREEQEEEERKKIDLEEAKLQAERRKEAIKRAKSLQYNQTDRVKTFHSALLLTEVMKEREAQLEFKKGKIDLEKKKALHFERQQQRDLEEATQREQELALKRCQEKRNVAEFQLSQVKERLEEIDKVRHDDVKEGELIMHQLIEHEQLSKEIAEKRKQEKLKLAESNKKDVLEKKLAREQRKLEEQEEDESIRKFVNAKRKMARMRKEKEQELFDTFQDQTEKIREKLVAEIQQKVDDEDDKIAKAVAEREQKRMEREMKKEKERQETLRAIKQHRTEMMDKIAQDIQEEKERDRVMSEKMKQDNLQFLQETKEKTIRKRNDVRKLKSYNQGQVNAKSAQQAKERDLQLELDRQNEESLIKEERQFQEYAQEVIKEAVEKKRNPYPLRKAAVDGPGGGHGPRLHGRSGLRPSYLVSDGTGVQLPYFRKDEEIFEKNYGHVGRSGKRLGFTW